MSFVLEAAYEGKDVQATVSSAPACPELWSFCAPSLSSPCLCLALTSTPCLSCSAQETFSPGGTAVQLLTLVPR